MKGTVFSMMAASALMLAACNDDGASARKPETAAAVDTFDDLPNCSKNREGETVDVTDDGLTYACQGGKWVEYEKPVQSYASEDDLPSCGKKNDGENAVVGQALFVCADRKWSEVATIYKTEDDLPNCTAKREGDAAFVEEMGKIQVCTDGEWRGSGAEASDTGSSSPVKDKPKSSSSTFTWDEDAGSSSSAKNDSKSSSSAKAKQVTFEEGVLWKPSYGKRVRGFSSDADEYTFLDDSTTNDWWRTGTDADNLGKSTASITIGSEYATIKTTLVYGDWMKGENGMNIASPEPYAMAAFNLAPKGYADISKQEGMCVVYSSQHDFRLEFVSKGSSSNTYDYWDVWVPGSSSKRTANLKFSNLPATWWQTNSTTLSKALTQIASMQIESPYRNTVHCFEANPSKCKEQTFTNNIRIYMIGEYGKCPKNNDVELGVKAVEFEDGVMWKPSYGKKARTYFGDVDEYSFYTDDPSGWWYTYTDSASGGESVAQISYQANYLQAKLTNVDADMGWADAAFGFELTYGYTDKGFVDLTTSFGKGICLEYSSGYDFDFKIHSNVISNQFWYLIPASATKSVINIDFKNDIHDYDWQENEGTINNMLMKASSFQFEFAPRHVDGYEYKTNTVKLYKIGKYGSCG